MLNWEEGGGHYHFMLCFAILLHLQSCTSRETVIAHVITYLQNGKERRFSILSYHLTNSLTGAL